MVIDRLLGQHLDKALIESGFWRCRVCDNPIRLMCQQGTGYCSQLCENEGKS
jgi:hypothetical protein